MKLSISARGALYQIPSIPAMEKKEVKKLQETHLALDTLNRLRKLLA